MRTCNQISSHSGPLLTFLLGVVLVGRVAAGNAAELTVSLANPPATGTVVFVLFDSANTFGDLRDPARVVRQSLDGRSLYRIRDVPPGEYALMVYYDENGNDRIDKNFIGIPREPLGFSNGYEPKGPPRYVRAAFVLDEGQARHFDVNLFRPLGKRGRLGVGIGAIARSSPYKDYDGGVYQFIPAVVYTGERLQLYGPNGRLGLLGSGRTRLAVTGRYRIGVYEESQSDFLTGMGDRADTFMAGLALQAELPGGVDISASYEYDVADRIGGGEARLELDKSWQLGVFGIAPAIALNWLGSDLANHDFGVPESKATADRPAYELDDALNTEVALGIFAEITRDWLVMINAGFEWLADDVVDSPIVDKDYVVKGFAAINYVF